jgi:hypothetical protein
MSVAGHGGKLQDVRCFLVANGRELLFDRVDDVRRRGGIEVEGGAYRRRLGFKCERFVYGDGHELLEKSSEGGRVNLFRRWRVSGGGLAICAGRCHAVGESLWAVVRLQATKVQMRRLKYDEGKWNARFAVRAPRPAHQPPILIHAVFAERKNAPMDRLRWGTIEYRIQGVG